MVGNAVLIRHGYEAWAWGDAGARETGWSSCARSFLTTMWGMLLSHGRLDTRTTIGLDWLERSVRDLDTPTARQFGSAIKLKHLLSYTSQSAPPGAQWSYSCREHWPQQHRILEEKNGETVQRWMQRELLDVLGGGMDAHRVSDDETNRIYGSPRGLARWGYLWLRGGRWRDQQLVDAEFVRRSIAGGPDGTGKPRATEGWQIHLVKHGAWTDDTMPGVPDDAFMAAGGGDRAFVVVVPSLDLVFARIRSHGVNIGAIMGDVCAAVIKS